VLLLHGVPHEGILTGCAKENWRKLIRGDAIEQPPRKDGAYWTDDNFRASKIKGDGLSGAVQDAEGTSVYFSERGHQNSKGYGKKAEHGLSWGDSSLSSPKYEEHQNKVSTVSQT